MLRAAILVLLVMTATAAVAVSALWPTKEPVHTLQTPALEATPVPVHPVQASQETENRFDKIRIGSFRTPEEAPGYEVLEETMTRDGDTRAARLLVDTQARSEAAYELITRDLKARYAGYDAVSAEFTDTTDLLDYNGGALIFNTPDGAYYMGYIYGPPNNRGYYVQAAG